MMNVLLIGGSSRMMDAIIDKLNKNGHRLYVLTGRRDKRFSYKHIFERYDFEYESCFSGVLGYPGLAEVGALGSDDGE